MNKTIMSVLVVFMVSFMSPAGGEEDAKGSKDHPLFANRMPGYRISSYQQYEYDKHRFRLTKKYEEIEGKKTIIHYYKNKETVHPGLLAIVRNYQNAVVEKGGEVLFEDGRTGIFRLKTEQGEVWVEIRGTQSNYYYLTIVERVAMVQVIQANALLESLNKQGFIALDIHFESGKAVIEADSEGQLAEVAGMLKANQGLRLSIEGHTDDQGESEANKRLSEQRAAAVVSFLEKKGVEGKRLKSSGHGEEKPIADNRTEEGRAKNRRVELVKQ